LETKQIYNIDVEFCVKEYVPSKQLFFTQSNHIISRKTKETIRLRIYNYSMSDNNNNENSMNLTTTN